VQFSSRKFIIFCVVFSVITVLFFIGKLDNGNYVILVGQCLTFYLGGNAAEHYIKSKNGSMNNGKGKSSYSMDKREQEDPGRRGPYSD